MTKAQLAREVSCVAIQSVALLLSAMLALDLSCRAIMATMP